MDFFKQRFANHDQPITYMLYNTIALACVLQATFGIILNGIYESIVIFYVVYGLEMIFGVAMLILVDLYKGDISALMVLLLIFSCALVPATFVFSEMITSEALIYFVMCITMTTLTLSDKPLIICLCTEFVAHTAAIGYLFWKNADTIAYIIPDTQEYVRIGCALIVAVVVCSILIRERNHLLLVEMTENERAERDAKQTNYAKDMFLVNVSHDIRTPLHAIIGTSEMIMDKNGISEDVRREAYYISNAGHTLLAITNDLLDFSRSKEEDYTLDEETYSFSALLQEVINIISVRMHGSKVVFLTTINPNIPDKLCGDKERIRAVFTNILQNSVKFTALGSIELTVDYELLGDDSVMIKCSVTDTGIGMKAETIEKYVNGNTEVRKQSSKKGELEVEPTQVAGLGLKLCRRTLDAMGGSLRAESIYGDGSTFHFQYVQKVGSKEKMQSVKADNKYALVFEIQADYKRTFENIMMYYGIRCDYAESKDEFVRMAVNSKYTHIFAPLENYGLCTEEEKKLINKMRLVLITEAVNTHVDEEAFCMCTRPVHSLNIGAIFNGNKNAVIRGLAHKSISCPDVKVLVVDDNLINLDVATRLLKRYGCEITAVTSGREGINMVEQEDYDILFLDYMMPGMDGIDTLKNIRALRDERKCNIPAVALTANAVSGAKEMFLQAGFDEYVSKPIEVEHLENVMLRLLPNEKFTSLQEGTDGRNRA